MATRIIGILIGIAIMFGFERGLDLSWYVAFPVGLVGYLITRYAGWALTERRRLKREMDEVVKKARRAEPLS
jgi:hypothetical protein